MNRRNFLGKMTAATAATVLTPNFSWAAAQHKIENVGLQLYTVRKVMTKDLDGTLAKVAAIGYREVEGPLLELSPQETKAALARHGLVCPSTHSGYPLMRDGWPQVLEGCHVIGAKYVNIPWIPGSIRNGPDGLKRVADDFNRAGEMSKKAGIQLAFHDHWIDFDPTPSGKLVYDILLERFDPSLVKMELDICWSTVGGIDAVQYFERYPGRFPLVHLKDLKKIPSPTVAQGSKIDGEDVIPLMTEVGSGVIDWKRILAHAHQGGVQHYFVEEDDPKDPIESARVSYEYLTKLRF